MSNLQKSCCFICKRSVYCIKIAKKYIFFRGMYIRQLQNIEKVVVDNLQYYRTKYLKVKF